MFNSSYAVVFDNIPEMFNCFFSVNCYFLLLQYCFDSLSASSIDLRNAADECSSADQSPRPDMETGSFACSQASCSKLLPRRLPRASLSSHSKPFQTDKLDGDREVVLIKYVILGMHGET